MPKRKLSKEEELLKEVDAARETAEHEFKLIKKNPKMSFLNHIRAEINYQNKKNEYQKITGKVYAPPWFREEFKRLGG